MPLERVRREVRVGTAFDDAKLDAAVAAFRALYQIRPTRVWCAPDVLAAYATLRAGSPDAGYRSALTFDGIPLASAVVAPGIIVFEAEVDPERMGDW